MDAAVEAKDTSVKRDLDTLEGFAGSYNLTDAAAKHNLYAVGLEREVDPLHCLFTRGGWNIWVHNCKRMKVKSLAWLALECALWGFASSSDHWRSRLLLILEYGMGK